MIRLPDNTSVSRFNYFYLFSVVIYAGAATSFARSLGNPATIGNAVALLLSFIFCYKNNIAIKKNFIQSVILFSIYAALTFVNNKLVNPMWYCQIITILFIAYLVCQGYKKQFFALYEKIIYHLSIIAIVFWCIYLVAPNVVTTILSIFQFDKSHSEGVSSQNIIVYTLLESERQVNTYINILRNSGFAWEPGAFSCMLCLAVYCNMLRVKKLKLKKNKELIVILIALATTFSTTGYMIFLVMVILMFVLNKKYFVGILTIPVMLIIFQLPFVQSKMVDEYMNVNNVNIDQFDDKHTVALGRIASFKYDWEEFLRHPILGLGGYTEGTWLAKKGYNIATISGVGKLLSMYGIIMTALFIGLLYNSSKKIGKILKTNISWLLPVVVVGMMVSYNIWLSPLYVSFWMYAVYGDYENTYE